MKLSPKVILRIFRVVIAFNLLLGAAFAQDRLPAWRTGTLDIHHLSVNGDAMFAVFPDGTTLIFDAGVTEKEVFEDGAFPLLAAMPRPDSSRRPGEWYVEYIQPLIPYSGNRIDYAVVSHFDNDHHGYVDEFSPQSMKGNYKLTGVTDIHEVIEIDTLIDRAYPSYDYPVSIRDARASNLSIQNYITFVEYRDENGLKTERLNPGVETQIKLRGEPDSFPDFSVRNLKSNGTIWSGEAENTITLFDPEEIANGMRYSENPLSLAIKIDYGNFDYFTGGDTTGMSEPGVPSWFDIESKLAPSIGEVDVMTLNHHGVRDAVNEKFVRTLQPRVSIIQSNTSDHPGQEVFYRLTNEHLYPGERDIFATHIHEETKVVYGPWFVDAVESMNGHVVVRVMPGGDEYFVYILDDSRPGHFVKEHHGPFQSRNVAE